MKHNNNSKGNGRTMMYVCILLVLVAIAGIFIFGFTPSNRFTILLILACPLLHLWMMGSGGHKH